MIVPTSAKVGYAGIFHYKSRTPSSSAFLCAVRMSLSSQSRSTGVRMQLPAFVRVALSLRISWCWAEFLHAGFQLAEQVRCVQMFFHVQECNFKPVELLRERRSRASTIISLAQVLASFVCFWTVLRSASRVAIIQHSRCCSYPSDATAPRHPPAGQMATPLFWRFSASIAQFPDTAWP